MERLPNLIIIGFTNIDINIIPNKNPEILPGGAGYFASIAASRLTTPVGLVTRIGNDFPSDFLLTRVLPDGVSIIPNKHTSRYTITYYSDTDLSKRDIQSDCGVSTELNPNDIPQGWLSSTQYIHVGPMPPEQQATFITFLKSKSPRAIISTDTEESLLKIQKNIPLIKRNLKSADIIFMNRVEYAQLKDIVNVHPFAIIKLDKDGAICLQNGKEIIKIQAPSVKIIDATGAGDVFAGTFIASQMIHNDIRLNLETAVNISSLSVTQKGIQHLCSF